MERFTVPRLPGNYSHLQPPLPRAPADSFVTRITEIKLEQEGPIRIIPVMSFDEAKLHPAMAKNVQLSGYKVPTPIQKYCIPAIGSGHDVIGIAQTGKTTCFTLMI